MLSYLNTKNKTKSLQGNNTCNGNQFINANLKKITGACCFTSSKGSMTIEASLILPIFLFALAGCMIFGQMLMVRGQMYHGLCETARIMSADAYLAQKKKQNMSVVYGGILQKKYGKTEALPSILKVSAVSLLGSQLPNKQGEIELHMQYVISAGIPFVGTRRMVVKENIYQKAFTGYEPTDFELGKGYRYVTKYGNVYHNSLTCSHIMLQISESKSVKSYLDGNTSYKPCSKCAKNVNGNISNLYIPKEGDCYHTSLECSGLKRMVRKVTVWEVEGMRSCSRCGG